MKMLQLAKECKKLLVFTHVSTCYVNCDRKEYCGEVIYDDNEDIEGKVRRLMAMNPAEIAQKQSKLIGNFPNTYTYTKNITEKVL